MTPEPGVGASGAGVAHGGTFRPLGHLVTLRHAVVVVTGAGGFLGSLACRMIAQESAAHGLDVDVLGSGRSRRPAGWVGHRWITWDVTNPDKAELERAVPPDSGRPLVVIHGASLTASRDLVSRPDDVWETIVRGTQNVLSWAAGRRAHHRSVAVVNLSSMEAYGTFTAAGSTDRVDVPEGSAGAFDESDPRSAYGLAKRRSEELCSGASGDGLRAISVRPGHVIGWGCPRDDPRAIASFVREARAGHDNVLRSSGDGLINVIDSLDLLDALLLLLDAGRSGECYTVVNPQETRTVAQIAEIVLRQCGTAGGRVRIEETDRGLTGFAPPQRGAFRADRMAMLGWQPRTSLAESVRRTAAWWDVARQL